jgi:hypothetical protein
MGQINLAVVSKRTEQEIALGKEPPTDSLDYLPWGTRSLKVAVSGSAKGKVTVRPTPFDSDPDRIMSYTAESEEILFSWGGGWEAGVELENKPGTTKYIFFNVTHRGPETAKKYTTTLIAFGDDEQELGRLDVTLTRPEELPERLLSVEWEDNDLGAVLTLHNPAAGEIALVPLYMSRWWPAAGVDYLAADAAVAPPHIKASCVRNIGDGFSTVDILAQNPGDGEWVTLARVDGDIQFPLVDGRQITADLFYMAGHWALRLWFFWLDKGVAKRPETQGRTAAEKLLLERWGLEQEIPDAERVDLVFDQSLNLQYLCTDLHWHEMWAPYEDQGEVLQVSIAATKKLEVIIRGAEGVKIIAQSETQKRLPDPDRTIIPSDIVMERLRRPFPQPLDEGTITHKHTPYFHNVTFDAELTSSDVLKG